MAQYNSDQGIRTGYYDGMTPLERDTLIWSLHHRGLSHRKIAAQLGNSMTHRGVGKALERIRAGGAGQARDSRDC